MSPSSPFETHLLRIHRGLSSLELVHTSHDRWPLPPTLLPRPPSIIPSSGLHPPLRISVLDSSFNPPTLAHLALANASLPPCFRDCYSPTPRASSVPSSTDYNGFDAKLLLLSVRNADKALKPGDATYEQRLDMMLLLAKDIEPDGGEQCPGIVQGSEHEGHSSPNANIAVAILDEPTFVGKSRILSDFLHTRLSSLNIPTPADVSIPSFTSIINYHPQLTFIVGIDTLERLFAPRYYSSEDAMRRSLHQFLSPDGDDSRLICARRVTPGLQESEDERERRTMDVCREFVDNRRIAIIDIDENVRAFSSSEVRSKIRSGDSSWRRMVPSEVAVYIQQNCLYTQFS